MSDGAILEGTQQFQNGNGQVQFKIVLPSGRELTSEWLQPDMKKKAMVAWLDVVKAEAMSDADQARQEAREAAMKQRQAASQSSTEVEVAAAGPTVPSTGQTFSAQTAMTAGSAPSVASAAISSPDDFVSAGLKAAESDYDHWNQVAMDAAQRLTVARQNIDKWTNIKRSLEGHEQSADTGNSHNFGGGRLGDRPKRLPRKKRVAKSTDFQEPDVSDTSVRGN